MAKTKIAPAVLKKVRGAVRKAGSKGLDSKGLLKATGLTKDELAPAVDYLVNDVEELEMDEETGRLVIAEEDTDDDADESDEDEETDEDEESDDEEDEDEDDEEEDEPPAKSKKSSGKGQSKSSGSKSKGQKESRPKEFTVDYDTIDTLDEEALRTRIKAWTRGAEEASSKLVKEGLIRSRDKARAMLRKKFGSK